jgi:hypothetical protein
MLLHIMNHLNVEGFGLLVLTRGRAGGLQMNTRLSKFLQCFTSKPKNVFPLREHRIAIFVSTSFKNILFLVNLEKLSLILICD